jgi:hypothetical protein
MYVANGFTKPTTLMVFNHNITLDGVYADELHHTVDGEHPLSYTKQQMAPMIGREGKMLKLHTKNMHDDKEPNAKIQKPKNNNNIRNQHKFPKKRPANIDDGFID